MGDVIPFIRPSKYNDWFIAPDQEVVFESDHMIITHREKIGPVECTADGTIVSYWDGERWVELDG